MVGINDEALHFFRQAYLTKLRTVQEEGWRFNNVAQGVIVAKHCGAQDVGRSSCSSRRGVQDGVGGEIKTKENPDVEKGLLPLAAPVQRHGNE